MSDSQIQPKIICMPGARIVVAVSENNKLKVRKGKIESVEEELQTINITSATTNITNTVKIENIKQVMLDASSLDDARIVRKFQKDEKGYYKIPGPADLSNVLQESLRLNQLPNPLLSQLYGSDDDVDIQEFSVVPVGVPSFASEFTPIQTTKLLILLEKPDTSTLPEKMSDSNIQPKIICMPGAKIVVVVSENNKSKVLEGKIESAEEELQTIKITSPTTNITNTVKIENIKKLSIDEEIYSSLTIVGEPHEDYYSIHDPDNPGNVLLNPHHSSDFPILINPDNIHFLTEGRSLTSEFSLIRTAKLFILLEGTKTSTLT